MTFRDRADAGRRLGAAVLERCGAPAGRDALVLGLPRGGGVPVAYEVARALGADLDIIVVRKLGVPAQPELALGAVGEGGVRVMNDQIVRRSGIDAAGLAQIDAREQAEVARRAASFRAGAAARSVVGRTVVIVDDGVATGATIKAACLVARVQGAARVIVAVPIGAPATLAELAQLADDIIWLDAPRRFRAVGQGYLVFDQVPDSEVTALLAAPPEPSSPG